MDIISVDGENVTNYAAVLPEDVAENLERSCYRAIGMENGRDILVWREAGWDNPGQAFVLWFRAEDRETAEQLLFEYEKRIKEAGVQKSLLRLPEDTTDLVKSTLKEFGYLIKLKEEGILTLTLKDVVTAELLKGIPHSNRVTGIGELSFIQLRKGLDACLSYGEAAPEEILELPLTWFERELSCCVELDRRVGGFLLIHRMPSGALLPQFFKVIKPAIRQDLLGMLKYAAAKAAERYSLDTPIYVFSESREIRAFIAKLFPGRSYVKQLTGSREYT